MGVETFDLEEKRLREEITKRGARRVLLQLPEGLKAEAPRLAAVAEEAGAVAIVSADPCYGACDLALPDAKSLGADLLVHYGHSEMFPPQPKQVPTIYLEARAAVSVREAVEKAMPLLGPWRSVGLATTVQHIQALGEVEEMLRGAGKRVAVGEAGGTVKYRGQVTGCDYTAAKAVSGGVEAFLFVGGGRFHAVGVSLATARPTVVADPYEGRAYSVEEDVRRILRQRWASISEAKEARNFGVLVGLKTGQGRMEAALAVKERLEKAGRRATLLALREITPERLLQFPGLDAFVNTACPRVAMDDASRFPRPVLTVEETLVMLGEKSWEELYAGGWFERQI